MGQWFSVKTAKYPQEPLLVGGYGLFPDIKLKDCQKKVVINSFCLDNGMEGEKRSWMPKIMHNLPLGKNKKRELRESTTQPPDRGCNKLLWDCVMGSTGIFLALFFFLSSPPIITSFFLIF